MVSVYNDTDIEAPRNTQEKSSPSVGIRRTNSSGSLRSRKKSVENDPIQQTHDLCQIRVGGSTIDSMKTLKIPYGSTRSKA